MPRRIGLDDILPIGDVTERVIDGKSLFVDPGRACWITLAGDDAAAFRDLASEKRLRPLVEARPEPDVDRVRRVLGQAIRAGFFGDRINLDMEAGIKRVQIHLTNRCNLRCVHCYMDSGIWITPEVPVERWLLFLDDLAERFPHVQLSISGGEPLVSKAVVPVLERARLHGFETAMITNGLLLKGRRLEQVAPLLDTCAISFDGISPDTHDQIRGEGMFRRTYENIIALKDTPFRKILNITVLTTNASELSTGLREFLATIPFKVDVDLGSLVFEGRGVQRSDLAVSRDEFRTVLAAAAEQLVAEQASGDVVVGSEGSALWRAIPPRARMSCGYADSLVVYSDGSVTPCLTPRFIRGNIFKSEPGAFLDAMETERQAARVEKLPECSTCDLRHICGGRCHLPQLRAGQLPSQVECSDRYKDSMFKNLVTWGSSG